MATATYKYGDINPATYLATAAIVVDQVLAAGTNGLVSLVVSQQAIADTETGQVHTTGIFRFPKVSAAVIKAGETVDWDVSAGEVDDNQMTAASGDVSDFGIAMEDAGNGVLWVEVMLTPGQGTLT